MSRAELPAEKRERERERERREREEREIDILNAKEFLVLTISHSFVTTYRVYFYFRRGARGCLALLGLSLPPLEPDFVFFKVIINKMKI